MSRAYTIRNVLDKKHNTFELPETFREVFGQPEKSGAWLVFGKDKNGKTWGTLLLSELFSKVVGERVLYISAEQGISKSFKDAIIRAKLDPTNNNLHYVGYITLEELYVRLKKRNAPSIVVIDNITFYLDELKNGAVRTLLKKFPSTLFLFLAHEERGKPYTAVAVLIQKIAEIIIHVKGLTLIVSGRCPGGMLAIDDEKSNLYHGQNLN
ncbi:Uncharacterised protein [Sphingobacterium spiritivorum]|uniref:DNA repair protein RadA n=1 Tax=Sphingobacterium spiritivorum TaxID=258 RepID=A0A380CSR5_SPHSI|nr:hypothetical protein [Sphingobacterium spiritivorum]SUJ26381.1 Uncharacterised protein [Sphingobacterium spiritivorum]